MRRDAIHRSSLEISDVWIFVACSYDDPDRRMTAIEYIQTLERKVEELEGLLSGDVTRPVKEESTPPSSPDGPSRRAPSTQSPAVRSTWTGDIPTGQGKASAKSMSVNGEDEDVIETMVGADESFPLENGSFDSHRGSFAGLSLLQRMQNLCRIASRRKSDAERRRSDDTVSQDDFISAFDYASFESDSVIPPEAFSILPSKGAFDRAIEVVVTQSCCNMQFLDRPMLEQISAQVYSGNNQTQSRKSFALLYAVMALSRRFEPASPADVETPHSIRG